jgi:hypothetical protein
MNVFVSNALVRPWDVVSKVTPVTDFDNVFPIDWLCESPAAATQSQAADLTRRGRPCRKYALTRG